MSEVPGEHEVQAVADPAEYCPAKQDRQGIAGFVEYSPGWHWKHAVAEPKFA